MDRTHPNTWLLTTAALALAVVMLATSARAWDEPAYAYPSTYQPTPYQTVPTPLPAAYPVTSSYPLTSSVPAPTVTAAASISAPSISPAAPVEWPIESSWYTRVDYFHWNERIDDFDLVDESGALFTVGYARRFGQQRVRAELFGGSVDYEGFAQDFVGGLEELDSETNYLGVRGEMEYLFEPQWLPRMNFVVGLGTRFWIRELPDALTDSGTFVFGYEEKWWTIYPYLGLEKKRLMTSDVEFYWSSRLGLTAFTYEMPSINELPLWPKPGLTSQVEMGVRGPHSFISAMFETFGWGESDVVRGWLQPESWQYTIGLRTGVTF